MSDAERDAWLREALRHAPDANAAPPSDLSETILAQARAAARHGRAAAASARRRHPVVAFWDWLGRPPVAAGFASLVAATLVGLLWWDRPMDEGMPRSRSVASEGAKLSASAVAPSAAVMPSVPAADGGTTTERAVADAAAARDSVGGAAARVEPPAEVPQQSQSAMKNAARTAPSREAATNSTAANPEAAQEQRRKIEAAADAQRGERAPAKAEAFPRSDDERTALRQAMPEKKKDSASDDRASSGSATAPADTLEKRDAPLAKSAPAAAPLGAPPPAPPMVAAPPPAVAAQAEAQRREAPVAAARRRADELARTSPNTSADRDAAKRAPPTLQVPSATVPAPMPSTRGSANAEPGEKQASAFASPPNADARSDVAQRKAATATPLAPILAAVASDPTRWSRSTQGGGVVALDAGWRDWLTQLDAAARDRWQPATDSAERDGAATLRLVAGGRTAVVVRLDGTVARLDALERGERWQATLPAATAERLRAAAARLDR